MLYDKGEITIILWDVDPLLGKDHKISNYIIATAK
jgi:hypothetical protein